MLSISVGSGVCSSGVGVNVRSESERPSEAVLGK